MARPGRYLSFVPTKGRKTRAVIRSRRFRVGASALLLFVAPIAAAATDVCRLSGAPLQTEVEKGTAEIAEAYAKATGDTASGGKFVRACDWTCGSAPVITPMLKAFGFLQYNCTSTAAPSTTRRPTGDGTDSQMGLSITDDDYRQKTDAIFRSGSTGAGDLMLVPPALVDAAKDGSVKKLTTAVDAIPDATWMKFSSTSVDNDGKGAARVIIRLRDAKVPPRFEQWIQIAIEEKTGKLGRNVDFIAVQLRSDSTTSTDLTPPVVAFRGFSRTATGFIPEGGRGSMLSKCYSCHPSGLRPIIPAPEGTRVPRRWKAVKPVGTMLSGSDLTTQLDHVLEMTSVLGVVGPAGYTASENGPPLGPSIRSGRAEFVEKGLPPRPNRAKVAGCAARLAKDRRQEIVDRMDCQQCHDGKDRGILNAGTNLSTIEHKVVENVVAPMPPGVTDSGGLKPSERKILFECLQAEYAEILQEWLTSDLLAVP